MRYKSDDTDMTWRNRNQDGNNAGNGGVNKMAAFQPGQLGALAGALSRFGGSVQDWKGDLRNTYSATPNKPFNWGGGNGGGNGKPDPRNPGGGGPNQPGDGGFDPSRPRNAMMPMNRPMQMQMPQAGLLNAPMQSQQPRGLLGDMPPEVLAFLSTNTRR